MPQRDATFAALIELADDHLILGHRASEWCGHAPMLEEDLALSNFALDLIGCARGLYAHAGDVQGAGRSEDDLAYLRSDREYRNCLLVARPVEDFAHTMLTHFYFAALMAPYWTAASDSPDATIKGIAGKSAKEMAYHIRHAGEWIIRLGDGTQESASRMQSAVDALHLYTDELFAMSQAANTCASHGLLPDRARLRADWTATITSVFEPAGLSLPEVPYPRSGGRHGHHGEEMGHLLSDLQYMQRSYPGLSW
jgi:ring-1,2-phenylacetyl-CoA epoxidase subunit PaaC